MPSFSGASQPLKDARSPWYCLANVQEPPTLCKCFTLHLSPPSYPFQADLVPYNRAPATATPNAPSIPVPTTGAPPTAALLVWDGAPPDDVDGVDFLLVAIPVLSAAADPAVVALAPDAGFAFAAPQSPQQANTHSQRHYPSMSWWSQYSSPHASATPHR